MGKFQLFPDQAATNAARVDALFFFLCGITAFFTLLIFVLILIFCLKYRRRSDDERPSDVHAPIWMEISWIIIPLMIVMVIFGWGAAIYVNDNRPPANAMEINVVGKQWMWKIQHPDGQREINELHVPVNKPVKLVLTSQDVIHDFGLPSFRVKMDVIPGRYTTEWFQATKPGEYHIFCNQYCGTEHSKMVGRVVVMEPEKYQAWLAGTVVDETPAAAGEKLFAQYSCMTCHSQHGPSLAGVFGSKVKVREDGVLKEVTADEDYIRESILNPPRKIVDGYPPLMPSYQGQLSEEQLLQLIAYIKQLGNNAGPVDSMKMLNRYAPPAPADPNYKEITGKP
jgi:cytochrome c oxidase subunit 2